MNPNPAVVMSAYEAEAMPGPDGTVEWWEPPISDADAAVRLQAGKDVVVRGPGRRENRNKAREIMQTAFAGVPVEDPSHQGRMSLPHFHPPNRTPSPLHAFFESPPRHAKERKE